MAERPAREKDVFSGKAGVRPYLHPKRDQKGPFRLGPDGGEEPEKDSKGGHGDGLVVLSVKSPSSSNLLNGFLSPPGQLGGNRRNMDGVLN